MLTLADTLAAHTLGGFKVGVGFTLRICRMCMATSEQIQTNVRDAITLTTQFHTSMDIVS